MKHSNCPNLQSRRRKQFPVRDGGRGFAGVIAASISLFVTGCAPLMDAQSDLLKQARRGIEVARTNRASTGVVHTELTRLRRQRLDNAFDADVLDRDGAGALTADWVIAHRAAYAAALEVYATQDHALTASDETARRNLQAVDAALERLQWLQTIQNRWLTPRQPEDQP